MSLLPFIFLLTTSLLLLLFFLPSFLHLITSLLLLLFLLPPSYYLNLTTSLLSSYLLLPNFFLPPSFYLNLTSSLLSSSLHHPTLLSTTPSRYYIYIMDNLISQGNNIIQLITNSPQIALDNDLVSIW